MHYSQNNQGRLEIAPRPGKEPPHLPKWLRTSYIAPVRGCSSRLKYDSCTNPTIRSGDALFDEAERTVGTLGTIMSSARAGNTDVYVVITAGHIISDGDHSLLVKNRTLDSFIVLKVAPKFRRFGSRPLSRLNEAPSFQDDVGILFVENNSVKFFSRFIANLNVHYLASDGVDLPVSEMADPVSRSRRGDILRRLPMIVYKVGTATELTMGRLVRIRDNSPKGWYTLNEDGEEETDDEETEEAEKDDDEWLGVVEWMDPPFW
jgi:hypothetical protein